jgi:hypothetical protein
MDRVTRKEIAELLIPFMTTEEERRARLLLAIGDDEAHTRALLNNIEYTGNVTVFVTNLIARLNDFGEIEVGKPALVELLQGIRVETGVDMQSRIDDLCQKLINQPHRISSTNPEFRATSIEISKGASAALRKAIEALDSSDPSIRIAAVQTLAQMNELAAHETLINALTHPTRDVRIHSAFELAENLDSSDERPIPCLVDGLQSSDSKFRWRIQRILVKYGRSAIPYVKSKLWSIDQRKYPRTTSAMLRILSDMDSPEAQAVIDEWKTKQVRDPSSL